MTNETNKGLWLLCNRHFIASAAWCCKGRLSNRLQQIWRHLQLVPCRETLTLRARKIRKISILDDLGSIKIRETWKLCGYVLKPLHSSNLCSRFSHRRKSMQCQSVPERRAVRGEGQLIHMPLPSQLHRVHVPRRWVSPPSSHLV